jgi:hypothetical protein
VKDKEDSILFGLFLIRFHVTEMQFQSNQINTKHLFPVFYWEKISLLALFTLVSNTLVLCSHQLFPAVGNYLQNKLKNHTHKSHKLEFELKLTKLKPTASTVNQELDGKS